MLLFPIFWEVGHRGSCCDLCQRVFCLWFPLIVVVSGLTFRSLIHYVFILAYGVRKCSSFILLQVFTGWPVFPAPLVKKIVFSPLYILAFFVKDKVSTGAWIYLWAFCFVPLTYISVFVPVPYCLDDCGFVGEPEVKQVDSSCSSLLSQDCFGCLRFFVFPYKLRNYLL